VTLVSNTDLAIERAWRARALEAAPA